jgi:hypothetical protein
MVLTIDVRDGVADKVLYFLRNLSRDVTILSEVSDDASSDIDIICEDHPDFAYVSRARKERKLHPENYGTLSDVDW